jgi:DNA integrity scanning protein DisA with diadenylate cyclase activity
MSLARVEADLTGERHSAAMSFATKDEAIAYIVSLASHDIRVVESGDPTASQSAQSAAS